MTPRPLTVGDIVRDNDPRVVSLPMAVVEIRDGRALLRERSRTTRVRLDRIHLDDKPRRSGWSRVT